MIDVKDEKMFLMDNIFYYIVFYFVNGQNYFVCMVSICFCFDGMFIMVCFCLVVFELFFNVILIIVEFYFYRYMIILCSGLEMDEMCFYWWVQFIIDNRM